MKETISRAQFEAAAGPRGAQFIGDASELTDKILAHHEIFGFDRFVIQMAIGVMAALGQGTTVGRLRAFLDRVPRA